MEIEKKNIFLKGITNPLPFISKKGRGGSKYPVRQNRDVHAAFIIRKLNECCNKSLSSQQVAAIRYKEGVYLEFAGASEHDLAIRSMENLKNGIRLLNVRTEINENAEIIKKAVVYIPAGKESYFLKKVEDYANPDLDKKNPKNNDLVRSIDDVQLAVLESFWIGKKESMPVETPVWCEVWLRTVKDNVAVSEENLEKCCSELQIEIKESHIVFPERVVRLINADKSKLQELILTCDYIAEFRRAPEATSFFDNMSASEQVLWVDDLLSRTSYSDSGVTVCLLDQGVSSAHPLLAQVISRNLGICGQCFSRME